MKWRPQILRQPQPRDSRPVRRLTRHLTKIGKETKSGTHPTHSLMCRGFFSEVIGTTFRFQQPKKRTTERERRTRHKAKPCGTVRLQKLVICPMKRLQRKLSSPLLAGAELAAIDYGYIATRSYILVIDASNCNFTACQGCPLVCCAALQQKLSTFDG